MTKANHFRIFVVTCLLTVVVAGGAFAGVVNPVVDFGSGFALENGRTVDNHVSVAGDTLMIVGHVVAFNQPFDDLNPNDPAKEYTYVYKGLVSLGTAVSGSGSFVFYDTEYSGGTLEIYCDTAMNSDFAVPATFMDGDLILAASLSGFVISTKSFNCSGTQNSFMTFTGGSLFNRVSAGGTGFSGITTGLFSVCASFVDVPRQAEGYFGLSDSKVDVDISVPAERKTWGEIKRDSRK